MKGYINGYDWLNVEAMKYWAFPSGTSDTVRRETVRNAIFGGEYMGALKVDGYYQRLLKDEDGNCFMIARSRNVNGDIVDKYAWVPQISMWMDMLPNGTCLLAEAYLPGNEGSKNVTSILGCLKEKAIERQKKTPLHFHIFDVMAYDGENFNNMHYEDRAARLTEISQSHPYPEYVHYAQFYEGAELWTMLQTYLAQGREGMVIMRKDAIVYTKRTPARISIKVKKELESTIDCFFTGRSKPATREYTGKEVQSWQYWLNEHTGARMQGDYFKEYCTGSPIIPITKGYFYGWAGSLEIGVYDGDSLISIGWLSNLPEEVKADPNAYRGKAIEVTAMEWDAEARTLRHGKVKCWRPDLNPSDCTLDKIVG